MERTEAEQRLIDAAKKGKGADCSAQAPAENDPAKGATWDESRTICAETIYQLVTGGNPEWSVHAKGVLIKAARIKGRLDFTAAEIKCPIVLIGCYVEEDITLTDASARSITLTGTHLLGLQADQLSVDGGMFLDQGFNAKGEVSLVGAKIDGALVCTRGTFEKGLNADGLKVGVVGLNEGFNAKGEVSLVNATIDGQLRCGGGTFEAGLNTDGLKVVDIAFNEGFNAKGDVRLVRAEIDGQLLCTGGTFEAGLNADGLKVGSVLLNQGFNAKGVVRLVGAKIDGQLICTRGTFENGLNAGGLKVGTVFLNQGFDAKGEVSLVGATIDAQLQCEGGTFEKGLVADTLKVGSVFLRKGFNAKGDVKLVSAEIGAVLDCSGGTFEGNLDLRGAHAAALADDQKSWPRPGKLLLDGFEYSIPSHPGVPRNAKLRIKWIELGPNGPEDPFLPQPYEQLVKVLHAMGDEVGARKVSIRERWVLRRRGKIGFAAWLWNWFLWLTVGYGYRAWLPLVWAVVVVLAGGFIFQPAAVICAADPSVPAVASAPAAVPQKVLAESTISELPHPFLYSIDVLVPFADLNQKKTWQLDDKGSFFLAFQAWYLFEELAGWVLTALLAAAATGLLKNQ